MCVILHNMIWYLHVFCICICVHSEILLSVSLWQVSFMSKTFATFKEHLKLTCENFLFITVAVQQSTLSYSLITVLQRLTFPSNYCYTYYFHIYFLERFEHFKISWAIQCDRLIEPDLSTGLFGHVKIWRLARIPGNRNLDARRYLRHTHCGSQCVGTSRLKWQLNKGLQQWIWI